MNMKIQRTYFIVWFLSVIPNFFLMSETGLVWYSVFNTLHPLIIIVIVFWALSINAQALERQSGKDTNQPKKEGGAGGGNALNGTELSDYSSFIEDRSDISGAGDNEGDAHINHAQANGAGRGTTGFDDNDLN
jgi:hypothetical protein